MPEGIDESSLKTIFDPTTLVRKGLCPVTQLRGQSKDPLESHSLYFEQHGTGPEKIIFIMGLNASSFSWEYQVEHFARSGRYTVLVFDNRGVGNSGATRGPYSTSGMAEDTIVLVDHIGWVGRRELHVVGVSLGGMIAMELASKIPERIASLSLTVTTPGGWPWSNLPPWKGFLSLMRLLAISEPEQKTPFVLGMLFPEAWLDAKADEDAQNCSNREVQAERYCRRMASTRIQPSMGAISQMCAGLTHCLTPERLHKISWSIPKVLIVTGDMDHLVDPKNSKYLKEHMPEAEYMVFEKTGHGIHLQWPQRFSKLIERVVKEGRERAAEEENFQIL